MLPLLKTFSAITGTMAATISSTTHAVRAGRSVKWNVKYQMFPVSPRTTVKASITDKIRPEAHAPAA